jgi:hypothetical protein
MSNYKQHAEFIDTWLAAQPRSLTSDQVIGQFERAFNAVWKTARGPVSDVTLIAIFERVTHNSETSFPAVRHLRCTSAKVAFAELRKKATREPPERLRAGLRLVLIELLSILSNITTGVLDESLYLALTDSKKTGKER